MPTHTTIQQRKELGASIFDAVKSSSQSYDKMYSDIHKNKHAVQT